MADRHLDDAQLFAFVRGELGDADTLGLERHVSACPPCAERLRHHAWLEVAMTEAAGGVASTPVPLRRSEPRRTRSRPAGLALAASLVLGLGLPSRWIDLGGMIGTDSPVLARAASRDATSLEAPACDVPDGFGGPLCPEPILEQSGAIAMSMPEPGVDEPFDALEGGFTEDDGTTVGLACDPLDG